MATMKYSISGTIALLGALLTTAALAGGSYIGGVGGVSNLNYDTKGLVYKSLSDNDTGAGVNFLTRSMGGSVNITSDNVSPYTKLFIGHRFNRRFGIELFWIQMSPYRVNATLSAGTSVDGGFGNDENGFGATVAGNVNGSGEATADLRGFGARINGYLSLTKNLDVLVGTGVARVKTTVTTSYQVKGNINYSGNVDGTFNGSENVAPAEYSNLVTGGSTFNRSEVSTETVSGFSPVFSIGLQYNIGDNFIVRGEAEMYGLPVNGLSVTTFSTGLIFKF